MTDADHDLLIELKTTLISVKADIKDLAEGTSKTISDHESRIRALEKASEDLQTVKKIVYGAVAFILTSVLGAIIILVIKK